MRTTKPARTVEAAPVNRGGEDVVEDGAVPVPAGVDAPVEVDGSEDGVVVGVIGDDEGVEIGLDPDPVVE